MQHTNKIRDADIARRLQLFDQDIKFWVFHGAFSLVGLDMPCRTKPRARAF